MAVVMPKKRSEVVAERTRRLAREAIDGPDSSEGGRSSVAESEMSLPTSASTDTEEEEEDHFDLDEGEGTILQAWPTPPRSFIPILGDEHEHEQPGDIATAQDIKVEIEENETSGSDTDSRKTKTITLLPSPESQLEDIADDDKVEMTDSPRGESVIIADLLDEDIAAFETTVHIPSITLVQQVEAECGSPTPYPEGCFYPDSPATTIEPDDSASQHAASPVAEAQVDISEQVVLKTDPADVPSMDMPPSPPEDIIPVSTHTTFDPPRPVPSTSPLVSLPPTPRPGLRKQKSLKQLLSFGFPLSSTPPPPLPERTFQSHPPTQPAPAEAGAEPLLPRKRLGLLSRQSKPSLRVDVKAPKPREKEEPTSAPTPTFPDREERPKMTKRFSLSNMSSAFKKMAQGGGAGVVPKVPDLPEIYRRGREEETPRMSEEIPLDSPVVEEVAGEEETVLSKEVPRKIGTLDEALEIKPTLATTSTGVSDRTIVPIPRLARTESFSSLSSTATTAAHEQQTLISVSPRTQRDPSASLSLQNLISRGPAAEVVIVTQLTQRAMHARQQSLEATIVLNSTPPPPLPRSRLMEREDSLRSISRSSSGSGSGERSSNESHMLKTPMVVPVASMSLDEIRRHVPISQPRIGGFMDSQVELELPRPSIGQSTASASGSTESFHTLPSLGSEMIVVDSPTYTLASTSSGASASTSVNGKRSKPASSSSKASTPKARSLVRMITSHGRRYHQSNSTSTVKASPPGRPRTGKSTPAPTLPPPSKSASPPRPEGFDTLTQVVQLKSLHFEELDLDFSKLDWMQR